MTPGAEVTVFGGGPAAQAEPAESLTPVGFGAAGAGAGTGTGAGANDPESAPFLVGGDDPHPLVLPAPLPALLVAVGLGAALAG